MSVLLISLGSTYNYGDFTDDNAFFWSSLDLSPYAGALGRTPHKIILIDSGGKHKIGYLAGVGAGETLGSELLTGWTNGNPGFLYDTFTSSGKDITSAIGLAVQAYRGQTNNLAWVAGQLYKSLDTLTLTGDNPVITFYDGDYSGPTEILFDGDNTYYFTSEVSGTSPLHDIRSQAPTNFSLICSFKRVTDPPATALHIVSSLDGTTRAWESVESGFDLNDISSWSIEQVESRRRGGYVFRNHH